MKELDNYYMGLAYQEAVAAYTIDEVPIGAVVVVNNKVVGKGFNQVERLNDPTAHAEMIAITSACNTIGSRYLAEASLFVTLEPCPMCAGAIQWAQLDRLIFASSDLKHGFYSSNTTRAGKSLKITEGIMEEECTQLLQNFFKTLR